MSGNETRKIILEIAQEEFLENGFERASLRKIADLANVSTGAIYGNFKNKNMLFEALVKDKAENFYNEFIRIQKDFEKLNSTDQKDCMEEITDKSVEKMTEYIYDNYKIFKLLICYSNGTKYEDYIERFIKVEEEQTKKFIKVMEESNQLKYKPNDELVHILCGSMIKGMFEIVKHDMKKENAREYLKKMHKYHSAGWYSILF